MNAGLRDERRPNLDARTHGLLPGVRGDEPQAARARGDAAVLQAGEEGRGRRAVRHQPDRLRLAQGRRAAALDPARGAACRGARECLRALARCGASVPPRGDPGRDRDRRAARDRRAPGRVPRQGEGVLRGLRGQAIAIARGLGFAGVYIGGHVPAATFDEILDAADSLRATTGSRSRARSSSRFPASSTSSSRIPRPASSSDVVSASYLESKRRRKTDLRVPVKYRFSRMLHQVAFEDDAPLFPAGRAVYRAIERAPKPVGKAAHALEQASKVPLFSCKDCGDCSLPRSPTSARSRSARRTSATAPAAGHATGSARSTTRSASGRRPTSASRPTARRRRCWTTRSWSRTTRSRERARGRTRSSAATTTRRTTTLGADQPAQ